MKSTALDLFRLVAWIACRNIQYGSSRWRPPTHPCKQSTHFTATCHALNICTLCGPRLLILKPLLLAGDTLITLGPLHTRAESRDHEIVRAHKKVSKGRPDQWSGRFLGITGWHPGVCKSNWLHVDILRFSSTRSGYILYIPLKWSVIFLQSWTSASYFSSSTGSFVTNCQFSHIIGHDKPPESCNVVPDPRV